MNIQFRLIKTEEILTILPLLKTINTQTPEALLEKRTLEMAECPNYECAGMYTDTNDLIGICGLWYSVRHYLGKSVEPDHVVINELYRGKSLGKQFFNWIYQYTKEKGYEAVELNTYTANRKSHKFYCNEGFEIYGFHFVKVIRDDQRFY